MKVHQTYAGHVRNGKLLVSDEAMLPEGANLIITVLDELHLPEMIDVNNNTQNSTRQLERAAFEEFFAAMAEISDEPLDDVCDSIIAKRVNITRALDL